MATFTFGTQPPAGTTAPATTGFTFPGATTTTTTPAATTGFTFPGTTTTTTATTTPFAFATTTPTTTTTTTTPATTGFGFGSGFTFGNTATTQQTAATTGPQPQQPLPSGAILPLGGYIREVRDPVVSRINAISESINPSSPQCRFQFILYNLLPPNSQFKDKLAMPPHAHEGVWKQGLVENPDPERLAPCLIVGWPDLLLRLQQGQKALDAHISTMQYLSHDVMANLITTQHDLHRQLENAKIKQTMMQTRILNLLSRIQAIKCGDMPLTEQEIEYKARLVGLLTQLHAPGDNLEKVQGLQELITIQAHLSKEREQQNGTKPTTISNNNNQVHKTQSKMKLGNVLSKQQQLSDSDDDNEQSEEDGENDINDDDNFHTEFGSIKRINKPFRTDKKSINSNLKTLLAIVNDQSMMIKELVDEVSLCVVDLQVCDETLHG